MGNKRVYSASSLLPAIAMKFDGRRFELDSLHGVKAIAVKEAAYKRSTGFLARVVKIEYRSVMRYRVEYGVYIRRKG